MNTLLELTWRGALMTLVIASLDRLFAAKIKARVRRIWWLLVPLAFLLTVPLPVLPAATSIAPGLAGKYGVITWFVDTAMRPARQAVAVAPSSFITVSWKLVIALAGAAVYLLVVLGRTYSALRRWIHVPLCRDPKLLLALEECKAETGITTSVGLVVSERISAPLILGWRHPRILLPCSLVASLSREQLRGVLFHELAHLRSMDVPCTFLFTLVGALHWFNPAAHLALRWWARFREEAADETAISWLGQTSGAAYGETLLHVLRHTNERSAAPLLTLSIVESVSQIRKRLTMIKHYERRSPHYLLTGTIFVAAALGILLRPVRAQNALTYPVRSDITIQGIVVSLSKAQALQFTAGHHLDADAEAGFKDLQSLIEQKKAEVVANPAVTAKNGQRALSESGTTKLEVEPVQSPSGDQIDVVLRLNYGSSVKLSTAFFVKNGGVKFLGAFDAVEANKDVTRLVFMYANAPKGR